MQSTSRPNMFDMPGPPLPYRNRKDLARGSQLRGFTRRRPGEAPSLDEMYMPSIANPWQRNMYGYAPPLSNRFEELGDEPLPLRTTSSSNNSSYGTAFSKDSNQQRRTTDYPREPVPFDKAAHALCQALEYAIKHCQGIKEHFEKEVRDISLWAPPKAIDALWGLKMDCDGIDLTAGEKSAYQKSDIVTYKSVMERLGTALKDMKNSGRPSSDRVDGGEGDFSQEVLRYTTRKLESTLSAIEELMAAVRKDRRLVELFVKELMAAAGILRDVEELWVPRRRANSGYRARAQDEEEEFGRW